MKKYLFRIDLYHTHKKNKSRTSLVVQQLRLCVPNAGGPGSIPGQGTRSCTLQLKKDPARHNEDPACHN